MIFLACSDGLHPQANSIRNETTGILRGAQAHSSDRVSKSVVQLLSIFEIPNKEGKLEATRFNCSGTLVSKRLVLTAAHCVVRGDSGIQAKSVSVSFKVSSWTTQTTKVRAYRYLKKYSVDSENRFDLALLMLPMDAPDGFLPARIPLEFSLPAQNNSFAAGFGINEKAENPEDLNWVSVQIADASYVQSKVRAKRFSELDDFNNRNAAVLLLDQEGPESKGICSGDSGGPIFTLKNNEMYLLGVNGFVESDRICNTFAGALSVTYYRLYLAEMVADLKKFYPDLAMDQIPLAWNTSGRIATDPQHMERFDRAVGFPINMQIESYKARFQSARRLPGNAHAQKTYNGDLEEFQLFASPTIDCKTPAIQSDSPASIGIIIQKDLAFPYRTFAYFSDFQNSKFVKGELVAHIESASKSRLKLSLRNSHGQVTWLNIPVLECP